eukprot:TRINITY_DN3486_c0_g1_i8.p1 TRINITY_DN3486_c0_g1~~TRINITY_DN3486_c0_g1_i8.p1  ORF type:complete len:2315 (-),score=561.17 TRINITY_DN3486_c0_g1_i8:52-6996(-)
MEPTDLKRLSNLISRSMEKGALMRVLDFLGLHLLYPLFLLGACLLRVGGTGGIEVFSTFYLWAFITLKIFTPHDVLPSRQKFFQLHVVITLVVSVIGICGQLVANLLSPNFLSSHHVGGSTLKLFLYEWFGWTRATGVSNGFLLFTGDSAVLVAAVYLSVRLGQKALFSKFKVVHNPQEAGPLNRKSLLLAMSFALLLFVCGISVPSASSIPFYFMFVYFVFKLKTESAVQLVDRLWIASLAFCILHLVSLFLYQSLYAVQSKNSSIFEAIASLMGLLHFTKFTPSLWPNITSFLGFVVLFLLICHWCKLNSIENYYRVAGERTPLLAAPVDKRKSVGPRSQIGKTFHSLWQLLVISFMRYGWFVCLAALAVGFFLLPVLVNFGILLLVCVGVLVRSRWYTVMNNVAILYVWIVVTLQYVNNWNFIARYHNLILTDLGLKRYEPPCLYLGIQCSVGVVLLAYRGIQGYREEFLLTSLGKSILEGRNPRSRTNSLLAQKSGPAKAGDPKKKGTFLFSLQSEVSNTKIAQQFRAAVRFTFDLILHQSYKICLLGLYFAGLKAVNVLNAGYLIFFIAFATFNNVAERLWITLVLYAELVVVLVSVWQLPWTSKLEGHVTELIGLKHYGTEPLWQGIFWNLLIWFFAVLEWHLLRRIRHRKRKGSVQSESSDLKLPYWLDLVVYYCMKYSLFVSYLSLLLVGLLDELSLVSLFYLNFLFFCCALHMASRHSLKHIKRVWGTLVFTSAIILAARYIYQFQGFATFVDKTLHNQYLTIEEIGLKSYPVRDLFKGILGDTAVLVIAIIQARFFLSTSPTPPVNPSKNEATDEKPKRSFGHILRVIEEFVKRAFILHAHKITQLIMWIVAIHHEDGETNVINLVFFFIVLISMFMKNGCSKIGLFVLLFVQLAVDLRLVFLMEVFDPYRNQTGFLKWLGMPTHVSKTTSSWYIVIVYVLVVPVLILERFAWRWKQDYPDDPTSPLSTFLFDFEIPRRGREEKEQPRASRQNEQSVQVDTTSQKEVATSQKEIEQITAASNVRLNIKSSYQWIICNFYMLYGYEIFTTVLILTLTVRNNALGLLYLFIIGACIFTNRRQFIAKALIPIMLFMIALLVFQYLCWLGAPPIYGLTFPWEFLSKNLKIWLCLTNQNAAILSLDFALIFLAVLAWNSHLSPSRQALVNRIVDQIEEDSIEEFQRTIRSWQNKIRFEIFEKLAPVILVLIFIAGSAQADVLSAAYVAFSLFFLAEIDKLFVKRNKWWIYLRVYNYLYLFVQMLYQLPLILPGNESDGSWQIIFGLKKIEVDTLGGALSRQGIFLDLLIMVLLEVQKMMFERRELDLIRAVAANEEKNASAVAYKLFQEQQLAIQQMRQDRENAKAQRWQRLLEAKQKRSKKKRDEEYNISTPKSLEQSMGTRTGSMNDLLAADEPEKKNGREHIRAFFHSSKKFMLHRIDNAIAILESLQKYKRKDEEYDRSRFWRFVKALDSIVQQQSKRVCFLFFVLNHAMYGSIISTFYPVAAFGYALLVEDPKPAKVFWRLILNYAGATITLKYLFQISFFCYCSSENGFQFYSVYPRCDFHETNTCYGATTQEKMDDGLTFPYIVGITHIPGIFLRGVVMDLLVFLSVLWHRHTMRKYGLWDYYTHSEAIRNEQVVPDLIVFDPQNVAVPPIEDTAENIKDGKLEANQPPPYDDIVEEEEEGDRDVLESSGPPQNITESGNLEIEEDGLEQQNQDVEDELLEEIAKNVSREFYHNITKDVKTPWSKFKDFYRSIFTEEQSTLGRDFYTAIFFTDFLSFLFLLIFQQDFSGIESTQVIGYLEDNRIPLAYLGIVMSQFGLIILDRIIYLFRSVKAKLVLQYVLIVFYHFLLFFYLPNANQHAFFHSKSLIFFYLLKSCYLGFSALQICYGYPEFIKDRFLMKEPTFIRDWLFTFYRAAPFLFELKTLLDYIVTDTTLTFKEYLKLEDLYAELFGVKCKLVAEIKEARPIGRKQSRKAKCLEGVVLFIILVILIWFPLVFLSTGNPSYHGNPVISSTTQIGLGGYQPLFLVSQDYNITQISKDDFSGLGPWPGITKGDYKDIQKMTIDTNAELLWQPSPPTLRSMIADLENPDMQNNMEISFTFTRGGNFGSGTLSYPPIQRKLSQSESLQLASVFAKNSTSTLINNFGPVLMNLPPSGNIIYENSGKNFSLLLTLNTQQTNSGIDRWWSVSNADNKSPLAFWMYSDQVPKGLVATLAASGIISLYVGVVLSVGRFLRLWVSDLVKRIYIDEMPFVDDLMIMIEDIFLARQSGDFLLEEQLFRELITLFRSPERLMRMTKKSKSN